MDAQAEARRGMAQVRVRAAGEEEGARAGPTSKREGENKTRGCLAEFGLGKRLGFHIFLF
jgi:hypothetical protein